jgi:raffinose/stachyose/melibiose transport system permease protein
MLALWAFTQSMQIFDFGHGSAISVVLLLVTIVIVIPYLRWARRHEDAHA